MAIKKKIQAQLNTVELISKNDDAIDEEASDIDAYMLNPIANRQSLVMKAGEEPTVFICNFNVKGKEQSQIKNAMLKGMDRDTGSPQVAYGDWSYKVCQLVLKGIRNPGNLSKEDAIEWKQDGRGFTADSTMDELVSCGVDQEIFGHYVNLTSDEAKASAKN